EMQLLTFSIELPPGPALLRVRYQARACGGDEGFPTTTWQFPYILAPARSWGSFGGMQVTVYLPAEWQCVSRPALKREGDVLQGSFDRLPSDALVVVARAPLGPGYQQAINFSLGLGLLILAGGFFACVCSGRWIGRFLAQARHPWLKRSNLWIIMLSVFLGS